MDERRRKANFSMQMERHDSHSAEKIDLVLLIRVYQFNHEKIFHLWFLTDGRPIINQIISCTRFQKIVKVKRFNEVWSARRSTDKLQPLLKVFKMWNDTLIDTFVPGPYLTVDEQLLAFRGRCPFRQYILYKLGKYDIKIYTIRDSAASYVLKIGVYNGKELKNYETIIVAARL